MLGVLDIRSIELRHMGTFAGKDWGQEIQKSWNCVDVPTSEQGGNKSGNRLRDFVIYSHSAGAPGGKDLVAP